MKYPFWIDYEWLAIDGLGHVGRFTTEGDGPIPIDFLKREDEIETGIIQIQALPNRTRAVLLVELPCADDFLNIAEQGIFGYNWSYHSDAYVPLSVPAKPVALKELSPIARNAASIIRLDDITFGAETTVDILSFAECIER